MLMTCKNFITRTCYKCKHSKPLIDFYKDKTRKHGFSSLCKDCVTNKNRTVNGFFIRIYNNQRKSSKRRNHKAPNYTGNELKSWALSQSIFNELYNSWVLSEYNKNLTPSFDRKNDYLPYTLNKLTITTWQENNEKGYRDIKNGVNNKHNTEVVKLTLKGLFITKYYSIRQAERETGIANTSISSCCRGITETAGNFKWKYA